MTTSINDVGLIREYVMILCLVGGQCRGLISTGCQTPLILQGSFQAFA
jgi:hypothetical protein